MFRDLAKLPGQDVLMQKSLTSAQAKIYGRVLRAFSGGGQGTARICDRPDGVISPVLQSGRIIPCIAN